MIKTTKNTHYVCTGCDCYMYMAADMREYEGVVCRNIECIKYDSDYDPADDLE